MIIYTFKVDILLCNFKLNDFQLMLKVVCVSIDAALRDKIEDNRLLLLVYSNSSNKQTNIDKSRFSNAQRTPLEHVYIHSLQSTQI